MVFTVVGIVPERSQTFQSERVSRPLFRSRVLSVGLLPLRAGPVIRTVGFEEPQQIGESGEGVNPTVGNVTHGHAAYGAV